MVGVGWRRCLHLWPATYTSKIVRMKISNSDKESPCKYASIVPVVSEDAGNHTFTFNGPKHTRSVINCGCQWESALKEFNDAVIASDASDRQNRKSCVFFVWVRSVYHDCIFNRIQFGKLEGAFARNAQQASSNCNIQCTAHKMDFVYIFALRTKVRTHTINRILLTSRRPPNSLHSSVMQPAHENQRDRDESAFNRKRSENNLPVFRHRNGFWANRCTSSRLSKNFFVLTYIFMWIAAIGAMPRTMNSTQLIENEHSCANRIKRKSYKYKSKQIDPSAVQHRVM